ncbi:prolyl oligopeptidase family serine peptidase [Chryseobacterium sp. JK1]|uniref:S9 family peptidase n=1 Tax=Chryseobacterium sp. JK1 TaxID=874294 RepID=UPI003D697EBD
MSILNHRIMGTRWMMKLFFILIFWLMKAQFSGQKMSGDTLDTWISKFYAVEGGTVSQDGRWVTLRKVYQNNDSLLIFDTHDKRRLPKITEKASIGRVYFGHYAMLSAGSKTVWLNLNTTQRNEYQQVKKAGIWSSDGYCILTIQGELQIYNAEGKLLNQLAGVATYNTDTKGNLFIQKKTENGFDILKFDGLEFKKLLSLDSAERIELTDSGRYLIVYKKSETTGLRNLIVMNTFTEIWSYPLGEQDMKADFFIFREIGEGISCMIEAVQYISYPEKDVEIWYGSDRDLESREWGRKPSRKYWIWNAVNKKTVFFHTKEKEILSSIGNDRYFVVFESDRLQDYIHHMADLFISIYDQHTGARTPIGIVSPNLISSKDGRLILFMDSKVGWQIMNVETLEKRTITGKGLKKPYFSKDSKMIYFESENGLWIYNLEKEILKAYRFEKGGKVEILGGKQNPLCTGYNFYQNLVDDKEGLLLKVSDTEKGGVSYYRFRNEKEIMLYTSHQNVTAAHFSANRKKMIVLEENYNVPPRLWRVETNTKKRNLLFDAALSDPKAKLIKQQIVSYTTISGIPLKGILYYPMHYQPDREYPLIVHIYQKQSDKAQLYLLPRYDEVGFNIRTLLESGYFVYLPDCVTENGSPGWSGLSCVEQSLAALHHYPIKIGKLGLMGHSFGSYLTNFIATHTRSFSAFISGSGVSDLISSYFSYNTNYSSPHYWQLETGQYDIGRSFFEDKELYLKGSPVLNAEKVNAPVLLWTGLKDRNVVPEQTMEFYIALKRSNKQVINLQYPKGGHDLGIGSREAKDLNTKILDWWDYFLKGKTEIPWIDKEMKHTDDGYHIH